MIREPVFSGKFYPSNVRQLLNIIEDSFIKQEDLGNIPTLSRSKLKKHEIKGIMVPHAGYIYSARVAAHAYYNLVKDGFPETFILIGPNHTGIGEHLSVYPNGKWLTPLGKVNIDEEFANKLIEKSKYASSDYTAHINEHSIEVQLPILQYFSQDFEIVPICMGVQDKNTVNDLVESIISVKNNLKRDICIIASTDLSHFNNQKIANSEDELLLNSISQMNSDSLFENVKKNNITMCGYGPVMTVIDYCNAIGEGYCEVLKYSTSGNVTGDFRSVVGYGSALFK